jgi:hypothetical protein
MFCKRTLAVLPVEENVHNPEPSDCEHFLLSTSTTHNEGVNHIGANVQMCIFAMCILFGLPANVITLYKLCRRYAQSSGSNGNALRLLHIHLNITDVLVGGLPRGTPGVPVYGRRATCAGDWRVLCGHDPMAVNPRMVRWRSIVCSNAVLGHVRVRG